MAEVEHEDLVVTLETIVERMGDEIAPYAVELAKHLTASLGKVLSAPESAKEEEDDDATGILAAYGCMRAMSTVIEAVSSRPQLLPPIEEVFYPVLGSMLGGSFGDDLLEETLDVLTYLTYYSPEISPRMWEFWPVVLRLLQRSSIEYFERVLAVLDNFIGRGTTTFLSNPDYLVSVFQVCSWVLTNPDFIPGAGDERDFEDDLKNARESRQVARPLDQSTGRQWCGRFGRRARDAVIDVPPAAKLMEVVLMNCRGQVDTQVGLYLRLVSERLSSSARSTAFQDALVMVVFQALIYDAGLALRELAGMGALEQALHKLLGMVRERKPKKSTHPMHFRSEYQKKVVSLGLTGEHGITRKRLRPTRPCGQASRMETPPSSHCSPD